MHTTMKDARRRKEVGSKVYLEEQKALEVEAEKKAEAEKVKALPKTDPKPTGKK